MLISGGGGEWTKKDRLIAVALTLHEQSMCSGCGQSMTAVWDADADVTVQEHTCAGCKAREEYANSKSDGLGPGVKVGVASVRSNTYDPADEVMPVFE